MDKNIGILKQLERLKGEDAPLIIYCLLNRIPIAVIGKNSEKVNQFIDNLTNLAPFRNETVFGSIFNTNKELLDYINEENIYYDSRRRMYISYCSSTPIALKNIINFKSWIIGMDYSLKIKNVIKNYLEITLKANSISVNLIGLIKKSIEQEKLSFEKKVLGNFLEPEELRKRDFYFDNFKKILLKSIKQDYLKFLADIHEEEEAIKLHNYRTSIQSFVSAAKKIYLIISKIFLIDIRRENKRIETPKLSKETLLDVVNYRDASIQRILSFIQEEFFGFAEYVKGVGSIDFGRYVDFSIIGAKKDYLRRMGGF
ncbi:MAG: hypothetical protein ACFFAN_01375 [Promethearchaeota archaeon]